MTTCPRTLEVTLLKFVFEVVKAAVIECVPCEESGTAQAGTIPPLNVIGAVAVPKLHPGSGVAPS